MVTTIVIAGWAGVVAVVVADVAVVGGPDAATSESKTATQPYGRRWG